MVTELHLAHDDLLVTLYSRAVMVSNKLGCLNCNVLSYNWHALMCKSGVSREVLSTLDNCPDTEMSVLVYGQ